MRIDSAAKLRDQLLIVRVALQYVSASLGQVVDLLFAQRQAGRDHVEKQAALGRVDFAFADTDEVGLNRVLRGRHGRGPLNQTTLHQLQGCGVIAVQLYIAHRTDGIANRWLGIALVHGRRGDSRRVDRDRQ